MDVLFERGSQGEAKGHALLYFRNSLDQEQVYATYLIILPISVEITKYVPPFLMSQVGDIGPKDLSAFAFPPAPEVVESYEYLTELAELRDDDILYGGTLNIQDVAHGMMAISEAVQWYASLYAAIAEVRLSHEAPSEQFDVGLGVNEVLYGLMSDNDKLSELTKLVGRLRFATEGDESSLAKEAEVDLHLLASHLPEDHQISKLVDAAKAGGNLGAELADLYLRRCFHIMHEEYVKLGDVEKKIQALESEHPLP